MTVKTRETLMQRAMTGKPIMGQELRDLIDTMFWLKATPEQRSAEVVKQVVGRSSPAAAEFPDVPGTGFVKIGADRKWFTDPTVYLTQQQGDQFYFRNALFPMEPALYLAGDRTFKNFVDSARAAFTGGDGIDIVVGDIRVDSTVSRVGHQHTLTLSGDVSGSGPVTGTVSTTVNAIRGGVVPPPGTAGYFYWTGSSYSWVGTPPPTTIALDDLADVALASVAAGQVLWYDGSVGQWINKTMVANDLPTHASRHHSGGSDPLAGQSIAGLLPTSSPTFASLLVRPPTTNGDIGFLNSYGTLRTIQQWDTTNDRLAWVTRNDDGSLRATPFYIPRSSSLAVTVDRAFTVTGQTTLSTSLTGMLKATAGVVGVAGAADLPLHASRHQWDGADPIQGQQLSGLRAHETPTFGGIRGGSVIGYLPFLENNGTEIMRLSSTGMLVHQNVSLDGDLRIANLSGLLAATNGTVRLATALDLPAHTHYTSEVTEDTNLWFTYQRARDAITGSHPISVVNGVVSHVNTDGYKHVPANGTTNSGKFLVSGGAAGSYTWETISAGALPIHAFKHQWNGSDPLDGQSIEGLRTTSSPVFAGLTVGSLTGMVKATAGVLSAASASDLPAHASRHHSGGADPLVGQSIAGLLTTSSPVFADLSLDGSLWLRNSGARNWSIFGSNAFELASRNSDGSAIDWPITIGHDAGGVIRLGGTTSRPVNLTYTLQMGGTTTINSSREGILTRLSVIKSLGATIGSASRVELLNSDSTWGQSFWSDSGGNLRLAFLQGDSTWTDRYTFGRNGEFSAVSAKIGTLAGLIAATSGVLRAAISSDFPGVLNALSQLANGNGFLRNSGAGVVTWEAAIPAANFSPLQVTNFGGTGVNGRAYQVANNYGVGFQDARGLSWRGGLFNTDAFWGLAQDASAVGSFKPMVFKDGASNVWYKLDPNAINYKHYFKGRASFDDAVDIASGSLQLGGVDTITATREGRFTGLRLTNLSAGQIPVASDANGQITASGLTDDGTFLGISRTIRAWNSLARSGNTWTDLQWTQDANERVSILSSNSSGQYAYHSWVFVPPDAEATGRVLGGQMWGQKVSGKSGTAPGLKASMYAKSVGAGGSAGGFGGQIVFNFRPDNGVNLVDALKIGAFGGGTADAVETAILLRAKASFLSNFATIQDDAHLAPGLDILGTSNQGHIRILNNASASLLGGGIGDVEISGSKRVLIGNPGGGALLIGTNFTGINYPRFAGNTNWESSNRTGDASTADSETIVVYTGESNATESLPVASGSKRIIVFAHASNSGKWTLDADGTDMIAGELQANVGSITILPNSAVKQRRLIDHAFGLWVVI